MVLEKINLIRTEFSDETVFLRNLMESHLGTF